MQNNELLSSMFIMQQSLNDETNGKDWEKGYTKDKKIINWKRCIYMECAELLDSFSWKHWKAINKAPNWDNVRVEIVDIWHFIMSLILEDYYAKQDKFDKMIEDVMSVSSYYKFCKDAYTLDDSNQMEIINDIEFIINMCSGYGVNLGELLNSYFALSLKCGINLNDLHKYYIAKNILNKFRQNNGYKEATYKKIWNGKEDNEVMLDILNSGVKDTDELYKSLESAYQNVK